MPLDDEQMAVGVDLPAQDVDTEDDPELAAYYRDLAEVNETIANLYRLDGDPGVET